MLEASRPRQHKELLTLKYVYLFDTSSMPFHKNEKETTQLTSRLQILSASRSTPRREFTARPTVQMDGYTIPPILKLTTCVLNC